MLWPVDLSRPSSFFLDRRLADLKGDRVLCRRVLAQPYVETVETADAATGEGCGWTNSVRVTSAGGARLTADKLTCELVAALALWIGSEVQPEAQRRFGLQVATIQHRGGYACRNVRGSQLAHRRSEHAAANALDIYGFALADGRQISVLKHWTTSGPEAEFLAAIHARACRYFRVAIGPAYNAAHRDHFHYDRGAATTCR